MTRICKKCAYYEAIYDKGICKFWVKKIGVCSNCGKIVEEKNGCRCFKQFAKENPAMIPLLEKAMEDIAALEKLYASENFDSTFWR